MRNVVVGLGLAGVVSVASIAGCGGGTASGAALQVSIYPSDRGVVNGRRLESLARQFEQQYPCTAEDTISVQGVAPQTYSAEGCGHMVVFRLQCRAGVYSQICEWSPMAEDLMARASTDMNCSPDTMDMQPASGMGRSVMGCGLSATYVLQCQGACVWQLASPIAQVGPATGGGGNTVSTTGGSSSYVAQ
ncbi:MAG: hypothetical protein U0353_08650 [Sandaracinus sp.]